MIQDFIYAWHKNNGKLRDYIKDNIDKDSGCSYLFLVKSIINIVINPYIRENLLSRDLINVDNIHEIDDGDYQGTLIYIIPTSSYQPSWLDYIATYVGYGSCSGCDIIQNILAEYSSGERLSDSQVNKFMNLCLEIVENFRYIFNHD